MFVMVEWGSAEADERNGRAVCSRGRKLSRCCVPSGRRDTAPEGGDVTPPAGIPGSAQR